MNVFKIIVLEECLSSNTLLKNNIRIYHPFTVLRCIKQTKGRGRWGRKWFSGGDKGLTFSILFPIKKSEDYFYFPRLMVFSLIKLLKKLSFSPLFLWPNDIYIENKKLSGILNESITRGDNSFLISGIGININLMKEDFPNLLKETAISLKMLKGIDFNVDEVFENFLEDLSFYINQNFSIDKINLFLRKHSLLKENQALKLNNIEGKFIEGIFKGFTEDFRLKIFTKGEILEFHDGDIIRLEDAGN